MRTAPQMRCACWWLLQGGQHWRRRRDIRKPAGNERPCCLLCPGTALQLPESGDLEGAAGLLITYGTAWLALRERADLRPGAAIELQSLLFERQCRCCPQRLKGGAATLSSCTGAGRWPAAEPRRRSGECKQLDDRQLNGSAFVLQ